MNETRVAIAGVGAVTALGMGIEPLGQALRTNSSGLRPRDCTVGKTCQRIIAGWVPEATMEQLRRDDPAHSGSRAFLFAAAALKQAARFLPDPVGADVSRLGNEESQSLLTSSPSVEKGSAWLGSVPPYRRGLVLSSTKADIETLEVWMKSRSSQGNETHDSSALARLHPALLAADLASTFGVSGPVQCVSAACISGLLAIQQGAALIRRGQADLVCVVGVDLVSEFVLSGFTSLKSLDPEGCRPFDKARVGLSLGEGAGALVLARRDLVARPAAFVTGWGSSNDANHLTGPSRDGAGLALAINRALAKAGVTPDAIDYINAHGTGTPYNDNMESLALRTVFGERVPPFSSSKGLFGHTLGAAGILETILCLSALDAQTLPGTPRLNESDPVAPASLLREPRSVARLQRILKINCGFGGTNAAVVLERDGK